MRSVRHTGRLHRYTHADTWYLAWAADGALYSPFADGVVNDTAVVCTWSDDAAWFGSLGEGNGRRGTPTSTGLARITGSDPAQLQVQPLGTREHASPRWHGVYPSASVVHGNTWFYGTYYLHRWRDATGRRVTYELGPFAGFDVSRDLGRSWDPSPWDDERSMFGEVGRPAGGAPIRFGAPHVVDHGRDLEHSPDGKVYLLGHGTSDPDGTATWAGGDEVVLARVDPTPQAVNDPTAYEFSTGDGGWSRHLADAVPVLRWPGRCGLPSASYVPALDRYLLFCCVAPGDGGFGHTDTWICTARELTGPWETVDYLPRFGSQAYFVTAPSRFLTDDPSRIWLTWSANWDAGLGGSSYPDPPGSGYGLCLGEFALDLGGISPR